MTDEQINQRIAEACGWTDFVAHPEFGLMGTPSDTHGLRTAVEYYTVDLNAMHEAESILDEDCRNGFRLELLNVTDSKYFGGFDHIHATARERAEAFLRTVGKWEEVQK